MNDGQNQVGWRERLNTVNNVGMLAFRSLAVSLEVFLHHGFGERYLGLPVLGALVAMFIWLSMFPGHDTRPMMMFMSLYFGACVLARVSIFRRRKRGPAVHSLYTGRPWLMAIVPKLSEISVKRYIEMPLAFLGGVFLLPVNQPLGSYVMAASIALIACVDADLEADRRRAQDMYDGYLDQQNVAERFRRMRGE